MKIWKITCCIDDGTKIFQKTQHIVAPTETQAIEASLNYWENKSYDTSATLVNISNYEIQENEVVILNN